jgi:hypothetical protein
MRSVLNRLGEWANQLDSGGSCELFGAHVAMTQQLEVRAGLFHALRRSSTWDEVLDLISANGYSLIPNEEDFIAADMSTGLMFSLWDCGHSRLVFEERLGRFPDSLRMSR